MRRSASEIIRNLESRVARLEKRAKRHSTDIHKVLKEIADNALPFDWIFDPKNYEVEWVHYEANAPCSAARYKGQAELVYNLKVNPSRIKKYINVLTDQKNIDDLIYEDEDRYNNSLLDSYNESSPSNELKKGEHADVPGVEIRKLRVKSWKLAERNGHSYLEGLVDIHLEGDEVEYFDSSYYWR